jgi:MSHA pilin protein MshA
MVIVILGILSAFALPKFADFTDNAQEASIKAALGAVKSGSAIAHAQWLADGSTASAPVLLETVSIAMTVTGYPSKDVLDLLVDPSGYDVNEAPAAITIISLDGTVGSPCFSYTEATPPTLSDIGAVVGTGAAATCP